MSVDRSRLPELGTEPSFSFPEIQKTSLPNGLRVWTVEHRDVPVVAFMVLIPVGAAADPADRPGLAAVTADMLDEGSGNRSAIEVHRALASIGAEFDIEVGSDATIVALTTVIRFRREALALLGEILTAARFASPDFVRVRELRLNRLLQLRDQAAVVADRVFTETIYRDHPYGHLAIGTEASLRGLVLDDLIGFHRRYHVPPGATLIAVGNASHEDLIADVSDALGGWDRRDSAQAGTSDSTLRVPGAPPDADSTNRLIIVDRPGAAQSELRVGHVSTSRDTPDYHALLVLNMVLGGQFVSRINLNLRERKGYTYGARTMFDFRRGPGPFVVQTAVQTDATIDAIREVFGEVAAIRHDRPPTREELQNARAALTRGYPRGFETAGQIARGAAQLALYGLPDDYFSRFSARVAAADAATVARVAREYIDPDRFVTVIVGDRQSHRPPDVELGHGTVTTVQ